MPFLLAIAGFFVPRFVLALMWFFSDYLYAVFGGWVTPLVGFIVAPYATLVYAILAGVGGSFSWFSWLAVGLALLLDIYRWADWGKKKHRKGRKQSTYLFRPGGTVIEGEVNA